MCKYRIYLYRGVFYLEIRYKYHENIGKECILFLHGWGGNENSFDIIYNRLSREYSVLSINLSDITDNYLHKSLTMYDYVVAVSIILRRLKLDTCHIVCHSFGFRVALILSRMAYISIYSMVIIDGAGIKYQSLGTKLKIAYFKFKKNLVSLGLLPKSCIIDKGSSDYKNLTERQRRTFKNIVNLDLKEYVKYVYARCTIIWGKNDKDTRLIEGKYIHRNISDSRLIIYNTGHFSYIENPIEFVHDIEEHFDI